MGGVQETFEVLTQSGIAEGLRFAYAASQFAPAGIVVGGAAVLAGLLGAAGLKKVRAAKPPAVSRIGIPWVLGVALLVSGLAALPADAAVVRPKGQPCSVLPTDGHRVCALGAERRDHPVDADAG
jgi:hypothetical protein